MDSGTTDLNGALHTEDQDQNRCKLFSNFKVSILDWTGCVTTGLGHSVKASSVESLQELITSDSEGSYMGVGSPRDLQSPVFQDRPDTQVITQHKTT